LKRNFMLLVRSYIIVMIIPMLVYMWFYISSLQTVESLAAEKRTTSVGHMKTVVDGILENDRSLASELSVDAAIKALQEIGAEDLTAADKYEISVIQGALQKYTYLNRDITRIAIWYEASEILLMNDGMYRHDFYTPVSTKFGVSSDYLRRLFDSANPQTGAVSAVNNGSMFYIQKISGAAGRRVILIVQNGGVFAKIGGEAGEVKYIRDSLGEVIASGGVKEYVHAFGADGTPAYYENREVSAAAVFANYGGFAYIYEIPCATLYAEPTRLFYIALIQITLCLLAGALLIAYFVKSRFNPVARLMKEFASRLPEIDSAEEITGEEQLISAIRGLINAPPERLDFPGGSLRERNLRDMLYGGSADSEPEFGKYIVARFTLLSLGEKAETAAARAESEKLAFFILDNVMRELIGGISTESEFLSVDAGLIAIACGEVGRGELTDAAKRGIGFINENFNIGVACGISMPHSTNAELQTGYKEALDAAAYQELSGICGVQAFVPEGAQISQIPPQEFRAEFFPALSAGDFEAARRLVSVSVPALFPENGSVSAAHYGIYTLQNMIAGAIAEVCEEKGWDFGGLRFSEPCSTGAELLQETYQKIRSLESLTPNTDYFENMLAYINSHFESSQMNVNSVADYFGVDRTSATRKFKQRMGTPMLEYIQRLRVTAAIRLLTSRRELSVEEVAERSGFGNAAAMNRALKKFENKTAGMYRE